LKCARSVGGLLRHAVKLAQTRPLQVRKDDPAAACSNSAVWCSYKLQAH
jgi:hypothetical protein